VTVAGGSCTEAGLLATAALLQGVNAERFLQMQEVRHWVLR
jgi:thiamine biosynthesis lipoprotein